jgi:uncharacterized protein (DUF4415 family)
MTERIVTRKGPKGWLTKKQRQELEALFAMPDEEIDLSDIPEQLDWSNAVVGMFYRPRKKAVTLRLDADVLAWFKSGGRGYQTRINELLRAAMTAAQNGRRGKSPKPARR